MPTGAAPLTTRPGSAILETAAPTAVEAEEDEGDDEDEEDDEADGDEADGDEDEETGRAMPADVVASGRSESSSRTVGCASPSRCRCTPATTLGTGAVELDVASVDARVLHEVVADRIVGVTGSREDPGLTSTCSAPSSGRAGETSPSRSTAWASCSPEASAVEGCIAGADGIDAPASPASCTVGCVAGPDAVTAARGSIGAPTMVRRDPADAADAADVVMGGGAASPVSSPSRGEAPMSDRLTVGAGSAPCGRSTGWRPPTISVPRAAGAEPGVAGGLRAGAGGDVTEAADPLGSAGDPVGAAADAGVDTAVDTAGDTAADEATDAAGVVRAAEAAGADGDEDDTGERGASGRIVRCPMIGPTSAGASSSRWSTWIGAPMRGAVSARPGGVTVPARLSGGFGA